MKLSVNSKKNNSHTPEVGQVYCHVGYDSIWMRIDMEQGKKIAVYIGPRGYPTVCLSGGEGRSDGEIAHTLLDDKTVKLLTPINGGQIFEEK